MRRPRVLLDVDGPLTGGFFEEACRLLRCCGVEAHPHLIADWDIMRGFGVGPVTSTLVRSQLCEPGVASSFVPLPEAIRFVKELREWAEVIAVTAPFDGSPTWSRERESWLQRYFDFKLREIVSCRDKRLIGGDALLDDKLQNVEEWVSEYPNGLAILWSEPHNRNELWSLRASSYRELARLLGEGLK